MKNKKVLKQIIGNDIGEDSFYACYKIQYDDRSVVIKGTKSFENSVSGMKEFYQWSKKRDKTPEIKPIYVMEATGVYYEDLAYFLYHKGQKVSVQLAQKIKYFAKSCNLKTKTDKVDAKMIAEFGIEKNLIGTDIWASPSKDFKMIRDLAREHTSLKQAQTSVKSQLHALEHAHGTYKQVLKMKKQQISFYEKQIEAVKEEITKLVKLGIMDKMVAIFRTIVSSGQNGCCIFQQYF